MNYPYLEHIFMVPNVFEPLKFYCMFDGTGDVRGRAHLTPEEAVEAYKNWMFEKKNQFSIPMNKILVKLKGTETRDSCNRDEYVRIDGHSDRGISTYAFERQSALQGSPATEKASGCESIHH